VLISKKKQITNLAKHSGVVIGNYAEEIVKDFLRDRVKGLNIGTGIITDFDKSSKQCDIIIYHEKLQSPIFKAGDLIVIEPKSVKAVIEVKSDITTEEIRSSNEKFDTVKGISQSIPCFLFGFKTTMSIQTINDKMPPHKVCVLVQNEEPVSGALQYFLDDLSSKFDNL